MVKFNYVTGGKGFQESCHLDDLYPWPVMWMMWRLLWNHQWRNSLNPTMFQMKWEFSGNLETVRSMIDDFRQILILSSTPLSFPRLLWHFFCGKTQSQHIGFGGTSSPCGGGLAEFILRFSHEKIRQSYKKVAIQYYDSMHGFQFNTDSVGDTAVKWWLLIFPV